MIMINSKKSLLDHLLTEVKILTSNSLKRALLAIDRKDFISEDYYPEAYEDYPLPIGYGQTISQPSTVAFMLELLDIKKGNEVLDIGSGSGWTTALISSMTGEKGSVLGIERIPELSTLGKVNISKYNLKNANIVNSDNISKVTKNKFDRILVSAESHSMPEELLNHLKPHGILVIPINGAINKIAKTKNGLSKKEYPGFVFVPLINNE